MEQDASFGWWLAQRRQSLNLQRPELASRIGCAVVTLRKIEADERRPSRQIAALLAEQLAIPPEQREVFVRVARGELPVARLVSVEPAAAGPTNLPRAATGLAGRERELEQICAALARPEVRLLTLTGAPGVGKSRLALEAATRLHGRFADGAFLVALGTLSDPGLVLSTIAQALRVGVTDGRQLADRLGHYLRPRQLLLLLDDFEHVLVAAPQLARLLGAAPRLKLLATSRVALELSGEYRFAVPPLLAPPDSRGRPPLGAAEAQARYPAVDLFVRRARAISPGFALSDETAPAVAEICRRLDGLPLAIELAAARVGLFTPAELLAQLDNRFALLTSRARDLPERHLSLRRAIDWSYGLLTPNEQLLFRRLGVFAGGCTIEAAGAVCGEEGAANQWVVEGIATLLASSLLQRQEGDDGRSRFGMLETVRAYAREQLDAKGEAEALRGRHAAYYLALSEAAERAWDGAGEWALLRRLSAARDNLRAALRWALDTGDAALALRMTGGLFTFWAACSSLSEARDWIEAALTLPRSDQSPELVRAEAKTLNVAGYVAAGLGDQALAASYFERGLERYRALGDGRGIAWTIRGRASVHGLNGQAAEAEQLLDQSLVLCRAGGDAWGLAWSLYALAFLRLIQGDPARAQAALEDALTHLRRQGISIGVVRALFALGHARFKQRDLAGAEARYREGLALLREAPLLTLLITGLEGLAIAVAAHGQPLRAARLLGAAEALREATDARRPQPFQQAHERALATASAAAPAAAWAAAWAAGRALTATQALAEALDGAGTPASAAELVLLDAGSLHTLDAVS